jgi:predicted tellurium resistance membrane protein TerC
LDWWANPEIWIALLTLTALEIVLGIDNIIFISILTDKLPENRQALARRVGLGLAMIMRILLLFSITWIIRLTEPLRRVVLQRLSRPPGSSAFPLLGYPASSTNRNRASCTYISLGL